MVVRLVRLFSSQKWLPPSFHFTALQGHLKLPCSFFRNCPFRFQLISLSIGCHLIGNINLRRALAAAAVAPFASEESTSIGIPRSITTQYNVVAFFFSLTASLCISSNHFARESLEEIGSTLPYAFLFASYALFAPQPTTAAAPFDQSTAMGSPRSLLCVFDHYAPFRGEPCSRGSTKEWRWNDSDVVNHKSRLLREQEKSLSTGLRAANRASDSHPWTHGDEMEEQQSEFVKD